MIKKIWRDNTEPPKNYIWERLSNAGIYLGTYQWSEYGGGWIKNKENEENDIIECYVVKSYDNPISISKIDLNNMEIVDSYKNPNYEFNNDIIIKDITNPEDHDLGVFDTAYNIKLPMSSNPIVYNNELYVKLSNNNKIDYYFLTTYTSDYANLKNYRKIEGAFIAKGDWSSYFHLYDSKNNIAYFFNEK